MNFYDTEKILALLEKHGYSPVKSPEEADFVAVNTCSVRQHAEDRAVAFLSSHQYLRKQGKFLCMLGCTANLYGEKLLQKYPFIDIVCGAGNYERLPELLRNRKRKVWVTGDSTHPFIDIPVANSGNVSAFVTVTKGCENFCSYCVVPFTRGKLKSKSPETIYEEIKKLVEQGVKEIVLLGQNVNEYGNDTGIRFTEILEKIASFEGILRLWFLTSHPKDMPDELMASFKNMPKLYKHLHLPLQSGSDRMLKLMNRKYTVERYLEIIEKVRTAVPDISITSDIITGFPSESEDDFWKTVSVIKEVKFDDLFVFKYSERPGTSASMMNDDVPLTEKERRHKTILDIQEAISIERNRRFTGKTDSVFVLKKSRKKREGFFIGRSSSNKSVLFESFGSHPGTLEKVVFTSADRHYLYGYSCEEDKKQRLLLQEQE